jgi:hypothetical protein
MKLNKSNEYCHNDNTQKQTLYWDIMRLKKLIKMLQMLCEKISYNWSLTG